MRRSSSLLKPVATREGEAGEAEIENAPAVVADAEAEAENAAVVLEEAESVAGSRVGSPAFSTRAEESRSKICPPAWTPPQKQIETESATTQDDKTAEEDGA